MGERGRGIQLERERERERERLCESVRGGWRKTIRFCEGEEDRGGPEREREREEGGGEREGG
jgi:hypothetical protein